MLHSISLRRLSSPMGFGQRFLCGVILASSSGVNLLAAEAVIYLDPSKPVEERIDDLLPRMTLDEKISQISDSWGIQAIARLKVPALFKSEALHGQSYSTGGTIFPHAIAMAATWDVDLVRRSLVLIADECKAANQVHAWSPVLDVARDARWGRVEESFGEDPYLVSRMAVAWVGGFQSTGLYACPKHFAAHGQPLGGRDSMDVGFSEREMREVHLVPFRAAFKEAKAASVMHAYSTWNGVPAGASKELLQKILREEWGFDGFVVSDCGALDHFMTKHSICATGEEAAGLALSAGVDMECGEVYRKYLASAIKKGIVDEALVDISVRRTLRAKFKQGLFEKPTDKMLWDKLPIYDTPSHKDAAYEMAVESQVLLKNDGDLLPLKADLKDVAVIGPNADEGQIGDYSAQPTDGQVISVLAGLKAAAPGVHFTYARGCDQTDLNTGDFAAAVEIAKKAQIAIVVVGDRSNRRKGAGKATTGENTDGATLELPGAQRDLIKAIHATGTPVVLVVVNGKPMTLEWESLQIPAIVVSWYPGERGGAATADLLLGKRNFSGRLPITFPRHVGQEPLFYNYKPSGRRVVYSDMSFLPRYRFGHGLSYTTFRYGNLKVEQTDAATPTVSVEVENTGTRDGDEVVQMYVTDVIASVATPVMELKGFQRVALKKGEKKTVSMSLTPYQLSCLNGDMVRVVEPGEFRVHVGGTSPSALEEPANQKQSIGFKNDREGISGRFMVDHRYGADFTCQAEVPTVAQGGEAFPVRITMKNDGSLCDISEATLYVDGRVSGTRRFELEPGEQGSFTFMPTAFAAGEQDLQIVYGKKIIVRRLQVAKAPGRFMLDHARVDIDDAGMLKVVARAANSSSEAYEGQLTLSIDGKAVQTQPLKLAPGESNPVTVVYPFALSGRYAVQLNDLPAMHVSVEGRLGLLMQDVALALEVDPAGKARNLIDGAAVTLNGLALVDGRGKAKAVQFTGDGKSLEPGTIELFGKAFTLATWVRVDTFAKNGQVPLFGGVAPMGAGQDEVGTKLSAGLNDKKLYLDFSGSSLAGNTEIAIGQWVHVAFTYDPLSGFGDVYLNGKRDQHRKLKTCLSPLQMIGKAPSLPAGAFAMQEVVVVRSCCDERAIRLLMEQGGDALRSGSHVTEWRPITALPQQLEAWCELPPGTTAEAAIEIGDGTDKAISSQKVTLTDGHARYPLTALKDGTQVRIRSTLKAGTWISAPAVTGYRLEGQDVAVKWSLASELKKGSLGGGLSPLR